MTPAPLRGGDLVVVALGGAAGALARWLLGIWLPDGDAFAWTTLAINVTGAFALGALPLLPPVRRSHRVAIALGPGLLGGFTTVSAWAGQARELAASGHAAVAGLYVLTTLLCGVAAAVLGRRLSHRPEPADALT